MATGAALLGVVVLGALAVAEWRGWPFLRAPLEARAARTLGVPVRIDEGFRLHLLPATLQLGHLHVGAGGGLALPHLLEAHGLRLHWRWRDLWAAARGAPWRIQSLDAERLDLQLVRDAEGRASWQIAAGGAGAEGGRGAPPGFGHLQVGRAELRVDDAVSGTRLQASVEGGEGSEGRGTTGWRARAQGQWQRLPFELQAEAGAALPLVDEAAAAALVPLTLHGRAGAARVRFDGRVGALFGARRLDGEVGLAGPSLAPVGDALGLTLPQTPPFELAGRLAHEGGVWQLLAARASIGRSRLGGDFRFDTRTPTPKLSGTLTGALLALQDLGPAVGTPPPGAPRPAPTAAGGRVLPDRPFDLPSLRGMEAEVQVAIERFDFGSAAIGPLSDLRTQLRLHEGVLRLDALSLRAAGGRLAGSSSLDGRADPARWTLDLALQDIDIARWLPAVRRPGRGEEPYVSGLLGGQVQAAGRGRSTAAILGSLDGSARLELRQGRLSHLITEAAGIDLAQALGVWARGDDPLPLNCARADFVLERGVARIRRAVVDNADSTLRIAGQVNLADETLALQARARPKDLSPLSLRTPVTVTGTLGAPRVGVEGGRLAGKLLGSLLLGAVVGPLAALVPLVDTGDADKTAPCS